jgi:hypothetical protein
MRRNAVPRLMAIWAHNGCSGPTASDDASASRSAWSGHR